MRTVAIIQARLESTRLPAKILLDLFGKTALERCVSRARRIPGVDEVMIATSDQPPDDVIESAGRRLGLRVSRGPLHDVLARFARAAGEAQADAIVRLTSDCPLLDPAQSGRVVAHFVSSREGPAALDYASNVLTRCLPRGLDTEIMSREALERAHADATAPEEREHVTLHIYRRPSVFRLGEPAPQGPTCAEHRWTLDTIDDYRFLYRVHEALGERAAEATLDEVVTLLSRRPDLVALNAHVEQKKS